MCLAFSRSCVRLAGILTAVCLLASCGRTAETPKIGCAFPTGTDGPKVIRLLQQEIDAWQQPRLVEIVTGRSDRGTMNASDEVSVAGRLASTPGMLAVVGHQSSRAALLVAPIYTEAGLPFLVPTGTSRRLQELGPLVFPLVPDEDAEGTFIADFIAGRIHARRVTVFYLNADEYGTGLRDSVARALGTHGIELVDQSGVLPDSDMTRLVNASLARAVPDAAVLAVRTDQARQLIVALHGRLPGLPVVAGDGTQLTTPFITAIGASTASVSTVAFWHRSMDNGTSRAFVQRAAAAGIMHVDEMTAMMYDGLKVLAQAIGEVGADPAGIARYLRALGDSRPAFDGLTGPLTFGPKRTPHMLMMRAVDGHAVIAVP